MKPRTTLILVLVFVALGAYVYFGEIKRPAGGPGGTPTAAAPWNVQTGEVIGLRVRGDGLETRLTRPAGGQWLLEMPGPADADQGQVDYLIEMLGWASPSRTFDSLPGPAADYGLDEPRLEITLTLAGGRTVLLRAGSQNPQQTAYYVQVEGQPALYLMPSYAVDALHSLLAAPPVLPTPTAIATPTVAATSTPTLTPVPISDPGG